MVEVLWWSWSQQKNRRNLSKYDLAESALKLKDLIASKAKSKEQKRKMTSQNSVESNLPTIDTQKELAKMAGVSHDTIHKVEKIQELAPEAIKKQIRAGDLPINQGTNL